MGRFGRIKLLIFTIAAFLSFEDAIAQRRVFNFDGVKVRLQFHADTSAVDVTITNYQKESILVSGYGIVNSGTGISVYPEFWVVELGSFFLSFDNMHDEFYLKEIKSLDSLCYSIKLEERSPTKKLIVTFDYFDISLLKMKMKKGARRITFDPVRGVYSGDKFTVVKKEHFYFFQEQ